MNGKRAKSLRFMTRLLSKTIGAEENILKFKEHIQYSEDMKEIKHYEFYYSEFSPRRTYQEFKRLVKADGIDVAVKKVFTKFQKKYEEIKNKETTKSSLIAA